LEVLVALIRTTTPKVVVEFGVNIGRTAEAILEYVPGIETYVGIDVPFSHVPNKMVQRNEVPEQAGRLVRDDTRFQLLLPSGGSQELLPVSLPKQADAVFIDGDHSLPVVQHDTMLALQILRPGGLVIWHDYHTLGTVDVKPFLDDKYEQGWPLHHVQDTWIVFMEV
jgi:predicted O-methyltransferase YrrM